MAFVSDSRLSRRRLIQTSAAGAVASSLTVTGHSLSGQFAAAQDQPTPAAEQVLRMGSDADPRSIDPASAFEGTSLQIVRAAYEGLVAQVIGTTEITPALATEWTVSDDASIYTFTLRQGVLFHDGTQLDAEAVKKSFDRTVGLGLGPASLLSGVSSVNVIDAGTVEIVLTTPNAYFLAYLPKIGIVSPTAWEGNQVDGDYGLAYLEANTAGTGPFRLTEFRRAERMVLERFNEYWGGWEGPHLQSIIIDAVPSLETQRQMLVDGDIHFAGGLLAEDVIDALRNESALQVQVWPTFETDIMPINVQKAPTDDIRVRKALQLAFDYAGYRDAVLVGNADIPNGPIPPGFPGYDPDLPAFSQDLDQARALIEEAGVTGATLTMNYIDDIPAEEQSAIILQAACAEIGLNLEIRALPWSTMDEVSKSLDTADHLSILYMAAFTADPAFTLNQNYGCDFVGKPYNWSWYCNEEAQALIDQAQQNPDLEASAAALREAQALIVEDAPAIFFAHPKMAQAYSAKVQGFHWNPVGYRWTANWYDIWLAE